MDRAEFRQSRSVKGSGKSSLKCGNQNTVSLERKRGSDRWSLLTCNNTNGLTIQTCLISIMDVGKVQTLEYSVNHQDCKLIGAQDVSICVDVDLFYSVYSVLETKYVCVRVSLCV